MKLELFKKKKMHKMQHCMKHKSVRHIYNQDLFRPKINNIVQ